MLFGEGHYFVVGGHEVCTAMLRYQDSSTGISQAGSLVPIPSLDIAIDETGGKAIARTQDITDFDRKARHVYSGDLILF